MGAAARRWWLFGGGAVVLAVAVALVLVFLTPPRAVHAPGEASPSTVWPSTVSPSPESATAPVPATAVPPPGSATGAPASSAPAAGAVAQKLAAMTLEQRVGQVLMVSSPVTGADANSLYALDTLFVGNIFMKGRSTAGIAAIGAEVAATAAHVSGSRTQGVRPFVATDQEGGFVQVMQGPGFDRIPQAIEQGRLAPAALEADATQWGRQLAAAGVNVNLAPVLDTVPGAAFAPLNAPIGVFGREYGYTPADVSSHGLAFARGMTAAGVIPTVKHFPGLGRVTGNTDVSADVTDRTTVRNDPYVTPFRDAVNAGVPWLMVSNAYYPKIDAAQLAPFSNVVMRGMVRGDLGFKGIIVSDDICDAVQLAAVPAARRGVDFIAAGGTMALCTDPARMPAMYTGMVDAARANPAFAAQVDAAALLVLQGKAGAGLIG